MVAKVVGVFAAMERRYFHLSVASPEGAPGWCGHSLLSPADVYYREWLLIISAVAAGIGASLVGGDTALSGQALPEQLLE